MRGFKSLSLFATLAALTLAACGESETQSSQSFTTQGLSGEAHQVHVLDAQTINGVKNWKLSVDGDAVCSLALDVSKQSNLIDVVCPSGQVTIEQMADTVVFADEDQSLYSQGAPCADVLDGFDATALMLAQADTIAQLNGASGLDTVEKALAMGGGNFGIANPGFGLNANCGSTCESDDGSAQCCCGVNKRCKSYPRTCECQDATSDDFSGPGMIGTIQGPF
jgi:hypothetical protein